MTWTVPANCSGIISYIQHHLNNMGTQDPERLNSVVLMINIFIMCLEKNQHVFCNVFTFFFMQSPMFCKVFSQIQMDEKAYKLGT